MVLFTSHSNQRTTSIVELFIPSVLFMLAIMLLLIRAEIQVDDNSLFQEQVQLGFNVTS